MNLRTRLTVLYGGLFLVAGAVTLVALYLVVERRLDDELSNGDTARRIELLREQAAASGESTVQMPDGTTIPLDELIAQTLNDQQEVKNAALDALLFQGGLAVLAVGAIAAAAGWVVAGRGLQPLHTITATAQRIAGSRGIQRDLRERIGLTGSDDDIKRLAESFDAMLDTLDHAFDGQRRFVANASHELRTPLALERALLELESTKPGASPELVHLSQSLLTINERHTRLIDGLLLLVDSENEITHPEPIDLRDVAEQVAASSVHGDVALTTKLESAIVRGDPVMLEQLVRNLIENGIRHNKPGGWVTVEVYRNGSDAILTVANSGPVVPDHELPQLFEPFRRAERGSGRGFGLGLSIVRAIVTAHAGKIAAAPHEDGGLSVIVRFRLDSAPDHPLLHRSVTSVTGLNSANTRMS